VHTVRLIGWVQSSVACDAAEWDARYGFGVDDVINEIETGS
jgi:osmotically-inducible protein OsmY